MNHYRRVLKQRTDPDKRCQELKEENDHLKDMIDSMQITDALLPGKGQAEVIIAPGWVRDEIRVMKDAEKEKRLIPA